MTLPKSRAHPFISKDALFPQLKFNIYLLKTMPYLNFPSTIPCPTFHLR